MATTQQPLDDAQHPADRAPSSAMTVPASLLPVAAGETSSSAIAARARAEVEARFVYAMRNPRDFQTARRRILDACKRPGFAAKARYSKPVGGKSITGLSIRFAEEARVNWGNMDVTAMLVFDDVERRIYRVQGVDLETNATDGVDVIVEKFVERRHAGKGQEVIGQRLNTKGELVYRVAATEDDMLVKVNNQIAKSRRNVILTLLPADIKEEAEAQIIETQRNSDAQDPAAATKKLVDAFWSLGVTPVQLAELLGHPIEQTSPAELTLLRAYYTTMSDGEGTWAEVFEAHTHGKTSTSSHAEQTSQKSGSAGLKDRLSEKKADGAKTAPTGKTADASGLKEGQCEFCLELVGKGAKHRPDCPALT